VLIEKERDFEQRFHNLYGHSGNLPATKKVTGLSNSISFLELRVFDFHAEENLDLKKNSGKISFCIEQLDVVSKNVPPRNRTKSLNSKRSVLCGLRARLAIDYANAYVVDSMFAIRAF
jgi:hypothetical protein